MMIIKRKVLLILQSVKHKLISQYILEKKENVLWNNMKALGILLFLFFILNPLIKASKQEILTVTQGNNLFSKSLYDILAKESGNVFFSPISAHAVLSMVYQGSAGETKKHFENVLHVPDLSTSASGYKDIMGHLNNVPNVTLLIANKIYVAQGSSLKGSFKSVVSKQFLSEVENVDFGNPDAAAKIINTWVEEKTHDKIKDIVKANDLDTSTALVLVNAIYFKGNWKSKFPKERTEIDKFWLNDKDAVDVSMMNQHSDFLYKEDSKLDAKVLELPYSNSEISLVIVLPNKKDGISELEKKLSNYDLAQITENMYVDKVYIKLPKFKLETTIDLNEPLTQVGLGNIFQSSANFSNILEGSSQVFVHNVIQKAFLEVNEEGTEAAAATKIETIMLSARMDPPTFYADHPFLLCLVKTDDKTRTKLFTGRIVNPLGN